MATDHEINENDGCSPVEQLAEQYLERLRSGERPRISEYTNAHPALADEIHDVFRTLAMLEDFAPDHRDDINNEFALSDDAPTYLGEYRIVRELGRGGMGTVYEAEHATMRRRVALKVLHSRAAKRQHDLERFLREARAAGRLHHTNIVPVFEVGVDKDRNYYAMQCIRGQNLDLVIGDLKQFHNSSNLIGPRPGHGESLSAAHCLLSGRFENTKFVEPDDGNEKHDSAENPESRAINRRPIEGDESTDSGTDNHKNSDSNRTTKIVVPDSSELSNVGEAKEGYFHRVARVGLQVADALAYAHDQGVLHRDIKPSNLILDTAGTVWVTDFGLARSEGDNLTHTGDIVGTLRYMAPERFRGEADTRSDIYSLGLTLYELCTLQHAFDRMDRADLIRQVTQHSPIRPTRVNPMIPRDLETIVLKCIDREASARYASASALADDLRLFLDDRPIRSRRSSLPEQMWRWCRRNPQYAAMLSCIGLLLGVVFVGALVFAFETNRHAADLQVEARRARAAESQTRVANLDSQRSLYESYVGQAQASRWSKRRGQRFDTLNALKNAANLLPQLEFAEDRIESEALTLRNAAIAAMPLVDVRLRKSWPTNSSARFSVSPDGRLTAIGDDAGLITIRNIDQDAIVARLQGPPETPWICEFDSTGRFLAARFHNIVPPTPPKTIVWEISTGRKIISIKGNLGHTAFAFDPTRNEFAVGRRSKKIEVYSLDDGALLSSRPIRQEAIRINYAANGDLGVGAGKMIHVLQHDSDAIEDIKFPGGIQSFDWNSKGDILVGSTDNNLYVRDAATGAIRQYEGHTGNVAMTYFSHDGRLIASEAWAGTRFIRDAHTGQILLTLDGFSLANGGFTRQSRLIGLNEPLHRHGVWEVATGEPLRTIHTFPGIVYWQVAVSPTCESVVALAGSRGIEIWDIDRAQLLRIIDGFESSDVAFTPDGKSLIACPVGEAHPQQCSIDIVTDLMTGALVVTVGELAEIPGLDVTRPRGRTQHIGIDSNGRNLIALNRVNSARVVDLTGKSPPMELKSHSLISRVAISPDGVWAATATWKGKGIRLWNVATGELIEDLAPNAGSAWLKFSPDGRWLVASSKKAEYIWDTATWTRRDVKKGVYDGAAGAVTFSPDSNMVYVSHSQFVPRLLDPKTGSVIAVLESPVPRSGYPAFTPSGRRLIITVNGGMKIWDVDLLRTQLAEIGLEWE